MEPIYTSVFISTHEVKFIPAGNITTIDRFKRLHAIKAGIDEGKSDNAIADELGMSLAAVKKNKKYLKDLAVSDLTSEEISEKRQEIYLELLEMTDEVKTLLEDWKGREGSSAADIRRWIVSWLEIVQLKAKLLGLDNVKKDTLSAYAQINQLNQYTNPGKIDRKAGEKLAAMLKSQHERKVKDKYIEIAGDEDKV